MTPSNLQPPPSSLSGLPTKPPEAAPREAPVAHAAASSDTAHTLSGHDTFGGATTSQTLVVSLDIDRKVFTDRFDLLAELGVGGMGRVLKAFDRKLQRAVAVKRIKANLASEPQLLQRFLREAQLAARINHASVVTVYDILADDEGLYLVLEFVDGESLAKRLEQRAMEWRQAIELLLPICDAVAAAHVHGIIHRDIKPANILVPVSGPAKLADFGIARQIDSTGFTQSGVMVGTPYYIAPEQQRCGKSATEKCDLYSLAATAYHAITGEIPIAIREHRIPEPIRELLLRALEPDPASRPDSVRHFREALASLLSPVARPKDSLDRDEGQLPQAQPAITAVKPVLIRSAKVAALEQERWMSLLGLTSASVSILNHQFRLVPPGEFIMGAPTETREADADERPQIRVQIPEPLLVMDFPVTVSDLREFSDELLESPAWQAWQREASRQVADHPAVEVGLPLIAAFCDAFRSRTQLAVRLPTEVEWEYLARAGSPHRYWWGEEFHPAHAAYMGTAPAPRDPRRQNAWGLIDTLGNVCEWTSSEFAALSTRKCEAASPSAQTAIGYRVARGGSFRERDSRQLRISARLRVASGSTSNSLGFRLVALARNLTQADLRLD